MNKELHVLSISGGKDSAALAVYLKEKYPDREFKYLFFDTGEELQDTYDYLHKIESILGIEIEHKKPEQSFNDMLKLYFNEYLPSPQKRWCTIEMKLKIFLKEMKKFQDYTIYNYVGIRADENREGLTPTEENITTVMPFKEDGITLNDVKRILNDAHIGLPKYYDPIYDPKYDITYNRTRSGCYFCFFMKQIEWVWLYEKRPNEFKKAMEFEKSGYTWIQDMPLSELIKPENIDRIKKSYKKMEEIKKKQPIKNGTMMQEMSFMSKHDQMIEDIEKDKLCTMCTL
ncbi:MAG: phosphoadenosine phosphosulfate reductase family protein [Sulfurospirillum sp.]|nr:phosphoadenosine phosphosulfate reductase family protein [Sulfurospirillum sp.]